MLLINIAGLLLIGLIVWWFWLYRPAETGMSDSDLEITVANGTYTPSRIRLPAGHPVTIRFTRRDESPCAEMLLIPDLDISETLPLNQTKSVQLPALSPGDYVFHCQMQMYTGQIRVTEKEGKDGE